MATPCKFIKDSILGLLKLRKKRWRAYHTIYSVFRADRIFSVADYQKLVRAKIAEIQSRQKLPIIVGGSGLYVQAVLYDFQFTDEKVDEEARKAYYDELAKLGPEAMHNKLKQLDPQTAETIHPNNTRRVIRALEMLELSGVSKAAEAQNRGEVPLYKHVILGLGQNMTREVLYDRINRRVDLMMDNGLLEEVKGLWQQNIRNVQSIQAIGYKELYDYLDGKCTLEEAIDSLKQNSRRYAKRQLTYFRNKMDVHFITTDEQL